MASTDYDTSDKLYFEPLTHEDVLHIVETEKPDGVIVQFGGQTPLNLACHLLDTRVPIIARPGQHCPGRAGSSFRPCSTNGTGAAPNGTARTTAEAAAVADEIGFPVIVAAVLCAGRSGHENCVRPKRSGKFHPSGPGRVPDHPVLIDKFLEDAVEVDVDAIADGTVTVIGGIMEHIEAAGVHSGDSACVLPPYGLKSSEIEEISAATKAMARELNVVGLMNVQYAIKDGRLYVLEVNPRASRTVPFVSKATGVPLAKLATKIMTGKTLAELGFTKEVHPAHISVKEAVLPFNRFPDVDILLGPEMKSTGEVMGIDMDFGRAYAKSQIGAGQNLPTQGAVFISVQEQDKPSALTVARQFADMGFAIVATRGTSDYFRAGGVENRLINKVSAGRPHVVDAIMNGRFSL
ncbi:MAG: ATP-grasp domain-containing protein [Desulfobacterales bacterium]